MSLAPRYRFRPVGAEQITLSFGAIFAGLSVHVASFATHSLYGRRPRTKSPAQLIGELARAPATQLAKEVFIVDDNFIEITKRLWSSPVNWTMQRCKRYPSGFSQKFH